MTGGLADLPAPQRVVHSERVFEGHVWDVQRERFAFGDVEITREFVDHPGAVAIVAMNDRDEILLIQQYRHPIATRDWELPAGLLDVPGEDPLETAKRELAEEVDLEAGEWRLLTEFFTSPGGSNELLRVYLATDLVERDAFERDAEEADMELRWVSLDEIIQAIRHHRVRNGILVTAALALRAQL